MVYFIELTNPKNNRKYKLNPSHIVTMAPFSEGGVNFTKIHCLGDGDDEYWPALETTSDIETIINKTEKRIIETRKYTHTI